MKTHGGQNVLTRIKENLIIMCVIMLISWWVMVSCEW